jgi:hypothetical protein
MESDSHSPQNRNSLSITGLILLLAPISIWALWIGTISLNPSASQAEKVTIFLSYFPTFLRKTSATSSIVLTSAIGSIVFTMLGQKSASRAFKIVGMFVIFIASLIFFLQLFTML